MLALVVLAPAHFGLLLLLGSVALIGVVLGLRSPLLACTYLLAATLFRLVVPSGIFPVDPFLLAFAGVLASTWIWAAPRRRHLLRVKIDPLVCAIALYLLWNVISMVLPHVYPPGAPRDPSAFSVPRFIVIGIMMPLVMFVLARWLFITERSIRLLLWLMIGAAAVSAVVSILQSVAPELLWPNSIISNAAWPGRAGGVFSQPLVNGLVLILGFLVATLIASHAAEPYVLRVVAALVGITSVYAIFLTHTRAAWLSFVLVVIIGAFAARGFRRGFVLVLCAMALVVATNWSTFTSSDRSAGGVGSNSEVEDRLNSIATSVWAFEQKPLEGWGIGRFAAVNTYHHQRYASDISWERGFGIPSHLDGLGVLVELGIIGLALWLIVFVLIFRRLAHAVRRLAPNGMYGRALGLTALLCLIAQTIAGLTVDLRFFDFPNIVVMLFAGTTIAWERVQSTARLAAAVETERPVHPAPGPDLVESGRR